MDELFLQLAENETDESKRDIYLSFAAGKYPRGIQVTSEYFSKLYGKKFIKFKISQDPEEAKYELEGLIDSYIFKRGKSSTNSTSKRKDELVWNEIKKSDMLRQVFIGEFCAMEAEKRGLTQEQLDDLCGMINAHVFIDLISSENIILGNGIASIEGLIYSDGKYYFAEEDSRSIQDLATLLE